MKISFAEAKLPKGGALLCGVLKDRVLLSTGKQIDAAADGAVTRAMKASRFTGEKGQSLEVMAPAGLGLNRVVLAGFGEAEKLTARVLEDAAGSAVQKLLKSGEKELTIATDPVRGAKIGLADAAAHLAYGARLGGYRFDKYRTTLKEHEKPSLQAVTVTVEGAAAAKRAYAPLDAVADGVLFTRDLASEPANVLYPESLAKECRSLAKLGVEVEVLGEKEMKKLGMGALLGVGQGSVRESQLVVMQWKGGGRARPVAFIGKGVCFDTGGISIKPAGGMEEMKWDMGGAGAVIGAMRALAGRKAKANVVGVCALVENMPDGNAQRPGDVVTSMSGQTIEVLNTDAEGRLILADALWYTQDRFKPQCMVDLATLTGAMIVALGHEYAGVFGNDDDLASRLFEAGKAEDEPVWRLPLGDAYDKQINSEIADMQNIGANRAAGSIMGAVFLQRFVNKLPWAHLDIAGVAWSKKDKPTAPKGASGWGVRLLDRLVADHYEGR